MSDAAYDAKVVRTLLLVPVAWATGYTIIEMWVDVEKTTPGVDYLNLNVPGYEDVTGNYEPTYHEADWYDLNATWFVWIPIVALTAILISKMWATKKGTK